MTGPQPYELAGADQELAQLNDVLNRLTATWQTMQPKYDACNFDYLARIAAFMIAHIRPQLDYTGAVAVIAIAIERLTREKVMETP